MSRPFEVPHNCCERQLAVPREISGDSQPLSDRFGNVSQNFRGCKILRSKSREIAPKSVPPGCAQLCHDPVRSRTSVASVSLLCRVKLCAFGPKFSQNFRGRKILRSKPREIAPKSLPPGGAQLRQDPSRSRTSVASVSLLCRVRLCAIRSRFRTEIFAKFSRPQNFAF